MSEKSLKDALYDTAKDFFDAGVMTEQTMREFDKACLPKIKTFTPRQIKMLRERNHASQAVFAAYLNTTSSTVQKWEQGQKKPSSLALKLLNLVDRHGLNLLAA